jgi:hypothetical protein
MNGFPEYSLPTPELALSPGARGQGEPVQDHRVPPLQNLWVGQPATTKQSFDMENKTPQLNMLDNIVRK